MYVSMEERVERLEMKAKILREAADNSLDKIELLEAEWGPEGGSTMTLSESLEQLHRMIVETQKMMNTFVKHQQRVNNQNDYALQKLAKRTGIPERFFSDTEDAAEPVTKPNTD